MTRALDEDPASQVQILALPWPSCVALGKSLPLPASDFCKTGWCEDTFTEVKAALLCGDDRAQKGTTDLSRVGLRLGLLPVLPLLPLLAS